MTSPPHICASCGQVLGVGGGRCPLCGAEQPDAQAPIKASAMPGLALRPTPARSGVGRRAFGFVAGAAGLAALGALAWLLVPRSAPPPPRAQPAAVLPPPPIAPPTARLDPAFGAADLGAVDPGQVLVASEVHARAWNHDAVLVSLDASPVRGGKVDVKHGGRVVVTYARPAGSMLPGAATTPERFTVIVDATGAHSAASKGAAARVVAEPSCTLDRAWRTMVASGVPSSSEVSIHYGMDSAAERAAWETRVEGAPKLARAIDAANCAVIARR